MTSPINYKEVYSAVKTELETLEKEKQHLAIQIENASQRLNQILAQTEKLSSVSIALADFLKLLAPHSGFNSIKSVLSVTDIHISTPSEKESALSGQFAAKSDFSDDLIVSPDEESIAQIDSENKTEADFEAEPQLIQTLIQVSDTDANDKESSIIPPPESANINSAKRTLEEFDAEDFYSIYPHLRNAHQPIHVLASKLLEYFGFGLPLTDIARLIVAVGHEHRSLNFTDTVHQTLKRKRTTTGDFRYNPKAKVWELGRWENEPKTSEDGQSAESNTKATDDLKSEGKPFKKPLFVSPSKEKDNVSQKINSKRKISVYKAAR